MTDKTAKDCVHSSGVGGPFYSLIAGLTGYAKHQRMAVITPLISPLTLLVCLLCPPLYAWFFHRGCISTLEGRAPLPPLALELRAHLGALLMGTLAWWLALIAAYMAVTYRMDVMLIAYQDAAKAHQALQIGTPEQLEYSQGVTQTISIAGLVLVLVLALIMNFCFAALENMQDALPQALKAFGVNLPGYLLLAVVAVVVFAVIERYFAVLKLRYLEAYILGREEFDPAIPFIVLRIYAGNVVMVALAMMGVIALKIHPFAFGRRRDENQVR